MFIALRGAKNGRRDTSLRWVNSGQDGAEWSPSEGAAQAQNRQTETPPCKIASICLAHLKSATRLAFDTFSSAVCATCATRLPAWPQT